ncbi:MAG: tetratricopeptide repeat protein [Candidatus Krumholzibacteriales bacterium]
MYVLLLTPVLAVAFCNQAAGELLHDIKDSNLRSYIRSQLELNPPELVTASTVLTMQARAALENGNKGEAVRMLTAARDISSSNSEPSLLLAKIELTRGRPEFLLHLIDALKIQTGSFYKSALLQLNLFILLLSAAGMAAVLYLLTLAVKYNNEIFHNPEEIFSARFKVPRAGYLGMAALLALVILRPGFAIYIILLSALVWRVISRKEKTALALMTILIAAAALFAQQVDNYGPAVDERSITRKLSLLNEQGATGMMADMIRDIDNPEFSAEKNFALGTLMYRRGNLAASREYLKRSIAERNDFLPSYINLGNVYFMENDFDRALAGYRNATTLDSTSAIAHYNIGQTCIKKMHFNLSSTALKKARRFGIEDYREDNPVVRITNPEVLSCGFRKADLREISTRESRLKSFSILDLVFRPLIFIPVGWLWLLMPAGILLGLIISLATPSEWKIFYCDNCNKPVCSSCVDTGRGINLCSECSAVVESLSSVKVMEALLRRRRQNKASDYIKWKWRMLRILPGGPHILRGKTGAGLIIMTIFSISVNLMIRNGFYFKDPRFIFTPDSLWRIIVPLSVIAFLYLVSLRLPKPEGSRRYYILPQEFQSVPEEEPERDIGTNGYLMEQEEEQGVTPGAAPGEEVQDPFNTFIDLI